MASEHTVGEEIRGAGPSPAGEARHDDVGWLPMLLTRAWPRADLVAEFDAFQQDRHLPQLMNAPGARQALYYETIVNGLPSVYQGTGNRLVEYRCTSRDGLFEWLCSDELAAAVEDGGSSWFGRMNELDNALYTGNLYEVQVVLTRGDDEPVPDTCPVLLERFEVGDRAEEFDRWLLTEHVPSLAAVPGVLRVRTLNAIRGESPISYYESPGDRAVHVALDPTAALATSLLEPQLLDEMERSLRWDILLPYVRREVYRSICTAEPMGEPVR